MSRSVYNKPMITDEYEVYRHLFSEATVSSGGDKRWSFYGSNSEPGREMMTEYQHRETGDRIRCRSYDYEDGKYTSHVFTFSAGSDE